MTMRYIQKGVINKHPVGVIFEDWNNARTYVEMVRTESDDLLLLQKLPDTKEMVSATLPLRLVQKLFKAEHISADELEGTGLVKLTWDDKRLYLVFSDGSLNPIEHALHLYEVLTALPELIPERKLKGLPEEPPKKKKWQFWKHDEK